MPFTVETIPMPLAVDSEGVIRVGGTRVTLDTVVGSFRNGSTAEQIAQDYDVLSLSEVYAAITYYLHHRDEVERYLESQRRLANEIRQRFEAKSDVAGIRERLLARQAEKEAQDAAAAGG